jgi:carbon storage regulator
MLVLQRKSGESILIGEDIEIVVMNVKGKRIQLGFSCPDDVSIARSEVPPGRAPKSAPLGGTRRMFGRPSKRQA